MFLDAGGEVLGYHRGPRTIRSFAWTAGRVRHLLELNKKAAAGEAPGAADLALTRCELGLRDFDDLELEEKKLSAAERGRLKQLEVNAAVDDAVLSMRTLREKAERTSATEDLYEIYKGGVHPNNLTALRYWDYLSRYAVAKKNRPLMEDCVNALARLGIGERYLRFLQGELKKLE